MYKWVNQDGWVKEDYKENTESMKENRVLPSRITTEKLQSLSQEHQDSKKQ